MSAPVDGKPYSIKFELRPNYLYVYVKGEADSYEIMRAYWVEISQECGKQGTKKLLVEEDLSRRVDTMSDVYKSAAEVSLIGGLAGVKIAFVDRRPDHHDLNLFGELVATNRGLYCKVFKDFETGEQWLTSG